MSTPNVPPQPDEPVPPLWDAPPQPPAWDRPASPGWSAGPPPSGWGPPPAYGAPPGYGPASSEWSGPRQTDPKAVVALVLALASFVVLPFLPAVVALFVAGAARRDIDAAAGRLTGSGLVTAAKVISWVNIVLCVGGVVLAVLLLGALVGSG